MTSHKWCLPIALAFCFLSSSTGNAQCSGYMPEMYGQPQPMNWNGGPIRRNSRRSWWGSRVPPQSPWMPGYSDSPDGDGHFAPPAVSNSPYFQGNGPFSRGIRYNNNVPQSGGSDYFAAVTQEGVVTWDPSRMPLKVFINSGRGVAGYQQTYRARFMESLQEWTQVSGGRITFTMVSNPRAADITCTWTERLRQSNHSMETGNTQTLTRRSRYDGGGTIERADISIATLSNTQSFPDEQMKRVALHEIGHAIGLQGHSPDPRDIMYFATSPLQTDLTSRDINTFGRIYNSPIARLP
ncbi:MAG: matrixin family metalloprotease [Cyanobacteria bacterium]|nr:matrixin family metalloprotease [Cyanobacteriota bacterium]